MVKQMCAQAKDSKACEERASKMKDAHRDAVKACEGKTGPEQRECMVKQMCAQTQDPAACEARGKERMAQREKLREACKDKKGEDLKACIREQREKK
jgi:hypothetical protein